MNGPEQTVLRPKSSPNFSTPAGDQDIPGAQTLVTTLFRPTSTDRLDCRVPVRYERFFWLSREGFRVRKSARVVIQ